MESLIIDFSDQRELMQLFYPNVLTTHYYNTAASIIHLALCGGMQFLLVN